jgi:hypothetical protein
MRTKTVEIGRSTLAEPVRERHHRPGSSLAGPSAARHHPRGIITGAKIKLFRKFSGVRWQTAPRVGFDSQIDACGTEPTGARCASKAEPSSKAPVRELWMHCLRADQPDRRQGGIRAPAHSTIAESWFGQPSREIAHKRAIALPPAALRAVC